MSNSTLPEMIDPSNFMSLDKAQRETGFADISILSYSPEVLLDCTPMEPSYVWMGTGISVECRILDCFFSGPYQEIITIFLLLFWKMIVFIG